MTVKWNFIPCSVSWYQFVFIIHSETNASQEKCRNTLWKNLFTTDCVYALQFAPAENILLCDGKLINKPSLNSISIHTLNLTSAYLTRPDT